jgi:hypothetical protein
VGSRTPRRREKSPYPRREKEKAMIKEDLQLLQLIPFMRKRMNKKVVTMKPAGLRSAMYATRQRKVSRMVAQLPPWRQKGFAPVSEVDFSLAMKRRRDMKARSAPKRRGRNPAPGSRHEPNP